MELATQKAGLNRALTSLKGADPVLPKHDAVAKLFQARVEAVLAARERWRDRCANQGVDWDTARCIRVCDLLLPKEIEALAAFTRHVNQLLAEGQGRGRPFAIWPSDASVGQRNVQAARDDWYVVMQALDPVRGQMLDKIGRCNQRMVKAELDDDSWRTMQTLGYEPTALQTSVREMLRQRLEAYENMLVVLATAKQRMVDAANAGEMPSKYACTTRSWWAILTGPDKDRYQHAMRQITNAEAAVKGHGLKGQPDMSKGVTLFADNSPAVELRRMMNRTAAKRWREKQKKQSDMANAKALGVLEARGSRPMKKEYLAENIDVLRELERKADKARADAARPVEVERTREEILADTQALLDKIRPPVIAAPTIDDAEAAVDHASATGELPDGWVWQEGGGMPVKQELIQPVNKGFNWSDVRLTKEEGDDEGV
jgi:hypothetical protein